MTTTERGRTPAERSIYRVVDRYNAAAGRTLGGDEACRELAPSTRTLLLAKVAMATDVLSCGEAVTALQAASKDGAAPHRLQVERLKVSGATATAIDVAAPSKASRRLRFGRVGNRWFITRLGVD